MAFGDILSAVSFFFTIRKGKALQGDLSPYFWVLGGFFCTVLSSVLSENAICFTGSILVLFVLAMLLCCASVGID